MHYTQVNYLMDEVMPRVKPTTFKIISVIARQTWGWQGRTAVELSYEDLTRLTGIKSANTIKAAIVEAEPFINQVAKDNQGFEYSMKPVGQTLSKNDIVLDETLSENDISKNDTLSKNDTEPYQNLTESVSKNDMVYSGHKENKESKEGAPHPKKNPLEKVFTEQTGIMPNAGVYAELWQPYLDNWQERYGDKAVDMICRAVHFSRRNNDQRRKYTITSPQSLANIMANLEADGATNGQVVIGAR